MSGSLTTTILVTVGTILWLALIAAILLQTRAEKRRAEMHVAALRRLQFVSEPGAFNDA